MSAFTLDAPVDVRPYAVRIDGPDALIGDEERSVYLTVPVEALELLESLAAGLTVGEAVRRFEAGHDFSPDIDSFLEALTAEGFVAPAGTQDATVRPGEGPRRRFWNLGWLSPRAAQRLLSWPVGIAGAIVFAVAEFLAVADPGTLPTFESLTFTNHIYLWLVYLIGMSGVFLHELAHVVGARAADVSARLKLGNQMYAIVAETDISGIWLASRRQRYVALLAGPFVDIVVGSLLLIVVWLNRHHVITLPEPVRIVALGVLMSYIIRLVWQVCVFVRTDLYYVISTALRAPSLMADTRAFLRNFGRRMRNRPLIDQSGVGRREMRAVRLFSVVWIIGRFMQIVVLVTLSIPVIWFYVARIARFLAGESPREGAFTAIDVLSISLLLIAIEGGGLVLWAIQLVKARRRRLLAPNRVYVE